MFKLELLVENKRLGDVLEALDGLVVIEGPPVPVRNAKVVKSGNTTRVVEKNPSNGVPQYMRIFNQLVESGNYYPTNNTIANMLKSIGGSPTSSGAVLQSLIKKGYVRKKGPGEYALIVKAQAPSLPPVNGQA